MSEIDKNYFRSLPKVLLTKEQVYELAIEKKLTFQNFIIRLLEVDDCRRKIFSTWQTKKTTNKPLTKLAEDYGSTRISKENLRSQIDLHIGNAYKLEEQKAPINQIINEFLLARLSGLLYEKLYKNGKFTITDQKELDAKYAAYLVPRNKLIQRNIALVPKFAAQYANFGISILDLIQEGNCGLIRAVEKYDADMGQRISTYAALWIKQAIRRAIKNDKRAVRLPHHVHDQINKLRKFRNTFKNSNNREPTLTEILEGTGFNREKVMQCLDLSAFPISLDSPVGGSNSSTQKETLKDTIENEASYESLDKQLEADKLKNIIEKVLDEKEIEVISRRFGIGCKEESLTKLSKRLEMSHEGVRQIEVRAIEKLQKYYIQ